MAKKSGDAVRGKKSLENKGLVMVLVVLSLVIVGLVVGVVVVMNREKGFKNVAISCDNDELNDFETCVQEAYKEGDDISGVVKSYQDAIAEAKNVGDYDYATELIQSRASFLAVNDECSEMTELIDNEDLDGFSDKNKMVIYSQIEGSSITCGDEQARVKYREILRGLMEKVEE